MAQATSTEINNLLSGHGTAIPLFKVFMPENVMAALREVLFSGYIGEGPRVAAFEKALAPWCGTSRILALNSGTAALQLALRLAGVTAGDEVITTPVTCVATNQPILAAGAIPVWADIDPWTGTIDPSDVANKITPRTKAIICVHWGGYPCDLDALNALAEAHGIPVIEDACHAFGAQYHDIPVGAHSAFVCFSFQAIKHMTTGDGGILTCAADADCNRGRLLRWYGIDRTVPWHMSRFETDIPEYGYKYHMNDIAAAIGLEQLRHVGATIAKHRANAQTYDAAFCSLPAVQPLRYASDRRSAYWLYTVRVNNKQAFGDWMERAGITVSPVHMRNDHYRLFAPYRLPLPGVDEFCAYHMCIPVGWWLTDREVTYIIEQIHAFNQQQHMRAL